MVLLEPGTMLAPLTLCHPGGDFSLAESRLCGDWGCFWYHYLNSLLLPNRAKGSWAQVALHVYLFDEGRCFECDLFYTYLTTEGEEIPDQNETRMCY